MGACMLVGLSWVMSIFSKQTILIGIIFLCTISNVFWRCFPLLNWCELVCMHKIKWSAIYWHEGYLPLVAKWSNVKFQWFSTSRSLTILQALLASFFMNFKDLINNQKYQSNSHTLFSKRNYSTGLEIRKLRKIWLCIDGHENFVTPFVCIYVRKQTILNKLMLCYTVPLKTRCPAAITELIIHA